MSSEFFFQSNVASSTFHDPTFFDRINSDSVQGAADELRAVGMPPPSHIFGELEAKHVPSKNLSLLKVRQSRTIFTSRRFLKKTNEQILFYYYETSGWLAFARFLEEIKGTKKTFRNWLTFDYPTRFSDFPPSMKLNGWLVCSIVGRDNKTMH